MLSVEMKYKDKTITDEMIKELMNVYSENRYRIGSIETEPTLFMVYHFSGKLMNPEEFVDEFIGKIKAVLEDYKAVLLRYRFDYSICETVNEGSSFRII